MAVKKHGSMPVSIFTAALQPFLAVFLLLMCSVYLYVVWFGVCFHFTCMCIHACCMLTLCV